MSEWDAYGDAFADGELFPANDNFVYEQDTKPKVQSVFSPGVEDESPGFFDSLSGGGGMFDMGGMMGGMGGGGSNYGGDGDRHALSIPISSADQDINYRTGAFNVSSGSNTNLLVIVAVIIAAVMFFNKKK